MVESAPIVLSCSPIYCILAILVNNHLSLTNHHGIFFMPSSSHKRVTHGCSLKPLSALERRLPPTLEAAPLLLIVLPRGTSPSFLCVFLACVTLGSLVKLILQKSLFLNSYISRFKALSKPLVVFPRGSLFYYIHRPPRCSFVSHVGS